MKYALMIAGIAVALSRYLFPEFDQVLLVAGVSLLMAGVYLVSRGLSSKNEDN